MQRLDTCETSSFAKALSGLGGVLCSAYLQCCAHNAHQYSVISERTLVNFVFHVVTHFQGSGQQHD